MSTDLISSKCQFLKYAISHLENRISMIDHRSSFLIAAHGILFAVYGHLLVTLFKPVSTNGLFGQATVFCVFVAFAILCGSVFMLLKTIRPTKFPLGFLIKPVRLGGVSFEFLWPGVGWGNKPHPDRYEQAFEELDADQMIEGYKNTNFVLLGHVKRKMAYYTWAVLLIKILVLFYVLSLSTLSVAHWLWLEAGAP